MFNSFDELYIGIATRERQNRLEREAATERLLAEAQAQRDEPQDGRNFFYEVSCSGVQSLRHQRPDELEVLNFFGLLNKTVLCYNGRTRPQASGVQSWPKRS